MGCILGLGEPSKQKEYVSNIPWATVLMVTGIICYIETMSTVGVMDYLENVRRQIPVLENRREDMYETVGKRIKIY